LRASAGSAKRPEQTRAAAQRFVKMPSTGRSPPHSGTLFRHHPAGWEKSIT